MPIEKSEAVILRMFNWSESSRTVIFFSDQQGKIPLVDRGGRSLKSKRGRLLRFARLELTYYRSEKETSGYISDCELVESFSVEGEGSLGRLAYGSAACELLYLLLPEDQTQPALYGYFIQFLRKLGVVDKQYLPAQFLTFLLRSMSFLGYHPSVDFCVGCRKENGKIDLVNGERRFSPERGGLVCPTCQRAGEYYIGLSTEQLRILSALQRASLDEAARVALGYQETSLLLEVLTKFLKYHSGLVSDLKSLEFLDKLKKAHLS